MTVINKDYNQSKNNFTSALLKLLLSNVTTCDVVKYLSFMGLNLCVSNSFFINFYICNSAASMTTELFCNRVQIFLFVQKILTLVIIIRSWLSKKVILFEQLYSAAIFTEKQVIIRTLLDAMRVVCVYELNFQQSALSEFLGEQLLRKKLFR